MLSTYLADFVAEMPRFMKNALRSPTSVFTLRAYMGSRAGISAACMA